MTTKEIALTICEKIQNEYPKRPIWQTMLEIEDLINKHVEKQLSIHGVVKSFYCYDETVQIAEETGDKIIKCNKQCEKCKQ
jgi:hypothetical protein